LALAGEGSLESEIRRRAASLALQVSILGRVEAMDSFLASIDLFALPSHQEAMPLALLEAMSAARPVVASRVGGIPEVIEHGSTGLLVGPSSPAELAAALRRLARDPDLRRQLGMAGQEVVKERFGAARMVRKVEEVYMEVIEPRCKPAIGTRPT
jgi:glycosyltransferase involved in cell wall biosynthesis